MQQVKRTKLFGLALILGMVSAVGPLATDMYLPALPYMANELRTSTFAIQATLLVYFVGFGAAQLFWGPLSDRLGRRTVLIWALGIFVIGTLGGIVVPTIETLLLARFVQSIGAAALVVVPRALVRDLYTGADATKLIGLILIIIGVSPIFAPLIGSGILELAGWRAIFAILLVLSLGALIVVVARLPETLSTRSKSGLGAVIKQATKLFRTRDFTGPVLVSASCFGAFSILVTTAPFIYADAFGLSPLGFSLAFGLNGLGFVLAAQAGGPLVSRIGAERVIRRGVLGFLIFPSLLALAAAIGAASLPLTLVFLMATTACLGLIIPTTVVLAMDNITDGVGLASSLAGSMQMLVGAMAAGLSAFFGATEVISMAFFIAVCAMAACLVTFMILRQPLRLQTLDNGAILE